MSAINKPKLLVAADSYLPRWDGIARTLSELLPQMTQDFEIRLIIPDYPGERPSLEGVTYVPLPLIPLVHSGDFRFPCVLPWVIKRQLEWADILWTHTAVSIGGTCIREAAKQNVPIVSMIHSAEWVVYGKAALIAKQLAELVWLWIARKRYGKANILLTPGETTKQELLNANFQEQIATTPPGVNLDQFSPLPKQAIAAHRQSLGLPTDRPLIGYVGRFGPEKSLETLIEAHANIEAETNAHLVLVGGLRQEIRSKHFGKNVTVVGPTVDPHLYYQAMDVYVLTSLTESFPLGILEAMACGVTPVSTPVGAIPTFISSGKNGLLFQPKNVGELSRHLKILLADKTKLESLGQAARKTVEDGYTWKAAAARITRHIQDHL
ncbi:MAG: glycosyltransferase [Deltaproteobacteria bacterium]|nr:glycosyltransferase [Deltaproteobacteria bacterium]